MLYFYPACSFYSCSFLKGSSMSHGLSRVSGVSGRKKTMSQPERDFLARLIRLVRKYVRERERTVFRSDGEDKESKESSAVIAEFMRCFRQVAWSPVRNSYNKCFLEKIVKSMQPVSDRYPFKVFFESARDRLAFLRRHRA